MHCRMAHLRGVYRGLACQLRLRPTSLERRGGTLIHQQLRAALYLAAGEVGEGCLETDQRSDGEPFGEQHDLSTATASVLGRRFGVPGSPTEQRPQRYVLAEWHQPRLRVRAA